MEDKFDKLPLGRFDDALSGLIKQPKNGGKRQYSERDLYAFEFLFMPALAATDWVDAYSREACLGDTLQIIDNAMEKDIFIDFINFNASRYRTDGLEVYVYDFPKPPRPPFALYGVIICGDKGAQYYTLELSDNCYMFYRPGVNIHENFGVVKKMGKEEFVRLAISHYNGATTSLE